MTRLVRHLKTLIMIASSATVLGLGLFVVQSQVDAQSTAGAKITSLGVSGWTSRTATISYSLSVPANATAEVQLEYGTSRSYGSVFPSSFGVATSPFMLSLVDLQPGTTYHYRLKVRLSGSTTITDVSADKTFATRSGDPAALPIITIQQVDCGSTDCLITFTTASDANVKIGWDTQFRSPASPAVLCSPEPIPPEPLPGYRFCGGEVAGSYLSTQRSIRITNLTATTRYHFRMAAVDRSTNMFMTGNAVSDSELTTVGANRDRTFSTGGCDLGGRNYPIGACMPDGSYCSPSGRDDRCTNQCGASCAAGQTCSAAVGCAVDPVQTGSAYQCNKSECYDNGIFRSPAGPNCYASWPKCTANTVLKVTKDRGCNLWLSCGTSVQTTATKEAPAENLCLSLSACNQMGPNGSCVHYLPQGQCDNDPLRFCANDTDCEAGGTCNLPQANRPTQNLRDLTFSSPRDVKKIANLSGNVVAGLDWAQVGGNKVVQGMLPWQLMRQIGGNVVIKNADFETNAPNPSPWIAVPERLTPPSAIETVFEDQDNSINHILRVEPVTQAGSTGRMCIDATNPNNPNIGKSCAGTVGETVCTYTNKICTNAIRGACSVTTTDSCLVDTDCPASEICNLPSYPIAGISCVDNADCQTSYAFPGTCATGGASCSDDAACIDSSGPTPVDNGPCNPVSTSFPTASCQTTTSGLCGTESDSIANVRFSGAASPEFNTQLNEYYFAQARIKADSGDPLVRFELGFDGFSQFQATDPVGQCSTNADQTCSTDAQCGTGTCQKKTQLTYIDVQATSAWQTVTIGPLRGLSGATRVAAVCADATQCGTFFIDDVQVKPVLQVNTNPDYVTPSCRLYPKEDAPACDYTDQNGVAYKGWKGYCLENDSVTGSCLSWWPVDVIRGDSGIFGADKVVGYQDRAPLYLCAQAAGRNGLNDFTSEAYMVGVNHRAWRQNVSSCNDGGASYTIANCSTDGGAPTTYTIQPGDKDYGIYEDQITSATWVCSAGLCNQMPYFKFDNTPDFQVSSYNNPWQTGSEWLQHNFRMYRDTTTMPGYILWRHQLDNCRPGSNGNCIDAYMAFDATSKRLVSYWLAENDQTGSGTEAAIYQVRIKVKEQCSTVVKVVDENGENQAFAERINSKSYAVPELKYKRSSDAVPFAGISQPNATDPQEWPLLDVASQNEEQEGGQARSGAPYACKGNCATAVCRVIDNNGQVKDGTTCAKSIAQSYVNACGGIDSDSNGLNDDVCTGGVKEASNKGGQLFDNGACIQPNPAQPAYCQGTNECLTTPVDTLCLETKDVVGYGLTPTQAQNDAGACTGGGLRCSSGLGVCTRAGDPCGTAGNRGICLRVSNNVRTVACDGSCNPATATAANRVSYTGFRPDATTVSCYKYATGSCTSSVGYLCTGTSIWYSSQINCNAGCTSFCVRRTDRRTCSNDSNTQCTSDSDCTFKQYIPDGQEQAQCGTTFRGCFCEVNGQCVVEDNSATTVDERSYQDAGAAPKYCTSNADCTYSAATPADSQRYFAQEKIKRLFTQSYGIWTIDPTSGRYSLVANSDNPASASFVGWRPPTKMCPQETVQEAGTCSTQVKSCAASLAITSAPHGTRDLAQDDVLRRCKATVACDGQSGLCSGGTSVKYDDFTGTCSELIDAAGKHTFVCTGRCTSSQTYTLATNTPVGAPKKQGVRPLVPPDDYCAIPPSISNVAFTTGASNTAIIDGGSGSVGLKFNTAADPQQIPLSTITVDWGDGTPDSYSYPFGPRTDARKPHIFSHVYTYNKADNSHCVASTGVCTYPIRVQVMDNWGWCANARASGNASTPDSKGCDQPSSTWVDSGLKVILIP